MLTLHLARRNVEVLFIIRKSLFLSVNPTGAGLRFSVSNLRRTVGAWTATAARFLVQEVLAWKGARVLVSIEHITCIVPVLYFFPLFNSILRLRFIRVFCVFRFRESQRYPWSLRSIVVLSLEALDRIHFWAVHH